VPGPSSAFLTSLRSAWSTVEVLNIDFVVKDITVVVKEARTAPLRPRTAQGSPVPISLELGTPVRREQA